MLRSGALIVVGLSAGVGLLLLGVSLLPSGALAARLLGAAGEAGRAGSHTQELLTHFGERLRFAGVGFLGLALALGALRSTLAEMLACVGADLRSLLFACPRRFSIELVLLAAATVGALALRLAFIHQPMRYDEAVTFNEFASRPLYYGLSYYPDPNNHLLNTLLVHLAYLVLGNQPWVLRLPALLAGVLLVPATYWLARALATARPGTSDMAVASAVGNSATRASSATRSALTAVPAAAPSRLSCTSAADLGGSTSSVAPDAAATTAAPNAARAAPDAAVAVTDDMRTVRAATTQRTERTRDAATGAAVLAAVLVAASSYLVDYSTNSRGYTLQALAFVAMLAVLTRPTPGRVLLAAEAAALGAFALPTMLYGVAIAAAWLALRRFWIGRGQSEARRPADVVHAQADAVARDTEGRDAVAQVPTDDAAAAQGRVRPGARVPADDAAARERAGPGVRRMPPPRVAAVAGLLLALSVLACYLPVVLISGPEVLAGNRFVVPLDAATLSTELPRTLRQTWALWNRDLAWPLAVLLVVGWVAALWADARRRRLSLGLLAPAVCLLLVALQRVAPFERVWLFLLPLYFVLAADGLAWVVASAGTFAARRGLLAGSAVHLRSEGFVAGLAAAVFGGAMAFGVLSSGSIVRSSETGVFPDAERVAFSLRGELGPDDAVVTQLPASLPQLQYYFPRAGLPTDALLREPSSAARVFAVALPGEAANIPGWRASRTLARFSTAELVEFQRD